MRSFLILFAIALCARAQSELRSTVTVSGGFVANVGNNCCGDRAPNLGASYAFRLLPHLDLEAGVDTSLSLGTEVRGANYDFKADDRMVWVPFGVRGVVPLRNGRVETFAGGGRTL